MTQVVDSSGGTITRVYDNLDRLTSETTPQGSISYSYDAAERQTSMQVAGQPAVNYSYDNASRLTQIVQETSTTGFGYDNANRRTALTLPNGVGVSYGYDNGSRLTGISYQFGSNTLGSLTYTYDQLGRRTQVGGSFARTGLPGAVPSATYDAANELTNWNGLSISYDANGNMLSDGSHTFHWNARDEVATLNGVGLQYDAFGRRIKNLAGTSFLYNGANAAQELSSSTVTANLLSGGVDEIFTRTDSSGSFTPLKDDLGSTIALVDSSGSVQTSYTYDPFGGTSLTGSSNANEFQYTGRENEGNGLYFYRNRYYSPLLGRFISEDPLGFGGGDDNLYAYVFNDPINLFDPFGTNALPAAATVARIAAHGLKVIPGGAAGGGAAAGGIATVAVVAVGVTATGWIIYERMQLESALNDENAAYDEYFRAIHQANLALLTRAKQPGAPALAGRYSRQIEHDAYKNVCEGKIPSSGDQCSDLSREIDRTNKCIAMMQAYDNKYGIPGRHTIPIGDRSNRLQKYKKDYDNNCTE